MWRASLANVGVPGSTLQLGRALFTSSLFSQKAATLTVTPVIGLAEELRHIRPRRAGDPAALYPGASSTRWPTMKRTAAGSGPGRGPASGRPLDGRGSLEAPVEPPAGPLGGSVLQPDAKGRDEKPPQSGGDGPPQGAGLRPGAALAHHPERSCKPASVGASSAVPRSVKNANIGVIDSGRGSIGIFHDYLSPKYNCGCEHQ